MRIMFYGLQNSGATLLTLFAGQRPGSIVIPDLWTMYRAPAVDPDQDVCVKVTVTAAFPLERHLESFQPDRVFLVVRRPVDNIASLWRKRFAQHDGTPPEKFGILDEHFAAPDRFAGVFRFEDFAADQSMVVQALADAGWDLPADAASFPRTPLAMERHIWATAPYLYERAEWGTGEARVEPLASIKLGMVDDPDAELFCREHAPVLHAHYERAPLPAQETIPLKHSAQDEVALQSTRRYQANQLGLCESLLRLEDYETAVEVATEVCRLIPDAAPGWLVRARALEGLGRMDEAITLLRHAVTRAEVGSPQQRALRVGIATRALRSGDLQECVRLASSVLEEDPHNVAAHQALADAALQAQRYADAERSALAALEADPRSLNARRACADALFGLGRDDEARDWLRSCLAIAPDFQPALRKLAQHDAAQSNV